MKRVGITVVVKGWAEGLIAVPATFSEKKWKSLKQLGWPASGQGRSIIKNDSYSYRDR